MNDKDEGLGLSVAVYAFAMLAGLALFVLPILWMSGPAVYDNPGVTTSRLPGGPAYASRSADFPLAVLQHQQIVDQTMLAELNAKAKPQKQVAAHRVNRAAHRSYAQAPEADATEPRQRRPFFSLF